MLKTGDRIRVDLGKRRVDLLLPEDEIAARRAALAPFEPKNQTPWQEMYRSMVGQLGTGACLEPATLYLDVLATRGEARDNH